MLIQLNENCPLWLPSNGIHLSELLNAVARGRHVIVQPSPERLAALVPADLWRIYGELIRQKYKNAINAIQSFSSHSDCAACKPSIVAEYYSLPLVVVVENMFTDGEWLRLIANKLRQRLQSSFQGARPNIELRHAGGIGEIEKMIREVADVRQRITPVGAKLRLIGISDSDAKAPGRMSNNARLVQRAADEVGAPCHVLKKRAIENYIPDDALRAYCSVRSDRQQALNQIINLTGAARDHYDMKRGISADEANSSGIYPDDLIMNLGLGDFIRDLICNFGPHVTSADLTERDGESELLSLLDAAIQLG